MISRKATDIVCPICSVPVGTRCEGELQVQRIALAVRMTREQNLAARMEALR